MYPYSLQPETINTISSWEEYDWVKIMKDLFAERVIAYNIDFTSDVPHEKVINLYEILVKYDLYTEHYCSALLAILRDYLQYKQKYAKIQSVILVIDTVKPLSNFRKFAEIAVNAEYAIVLDYVPPRDFSNRIYLINALMALDKKPFWFSDYFMSNSIEKKEPAFYQVGVRYFQANHLSDNLYKFYLNAEKVGLDDMAISYIHKSFREYIVEFGKLDMLYGFVEPYCVHAFKRSYFAKSLAITKATKKLLQSMSDYIIGEKNRLMNISGYLPLMSWLLPINSKFDNLYTFEDFNYLLKLRSLPGNKSSKYDLITYIFNKFGPLQNAEIIKDRNGFEFMSPHWQVVQYYSFEDNGEEGCIYLEDCNDVVDAIELGISNFRNARVSAPAAIPTAI